MKNYIPFSLLFLFCVSISLGQSEDGINSRAIEKVKIFPNPATNIINVLGLQNSSNTLILVSDVYGNKVLEHNWEIKNNALNIPIANLEKGIYLISIHSKEQQIQAKFYKQ